MLHRAAIFLSHDFSEARVIGGRGAVGDCEIEAGGVGGEEEGDVVDG